MGCDIHPILERKFKDKWIGMDDYAYKTSFDFDRSNNKWGPPKFTSAAGEIRSRNYARFAKFAGVRGEGQDPKGMPDDASDLAKWRCEEYGQDGHSHSWLTLREALDLCVAADIEHNMNATLADDAPQKTHAVEFYFGVEIDTEDYDGKGPHDSIDNYRLVFWFDN